MKNYNCIFRTEFHYAKFQHSFDLNLTKKTAYHSPDV